MENIMQRIFDAKVPTRTDYMEQSLFDNDPEWNKQQEEELEIQLKRWKRTRRFPTPTSLITISRWIQPD